MCLRRGRRGDALEPRGRADPRMECRRGRRAARVRRVGGAQRRRRGGGGAAAVRHARPGPPGARVRAADQGRRPGARAHPVGGRTRAGRQARGAVLRLQRGAHADRPGAVHRAERGPVRGRVLGCRAGRRGSAPRRGQRARGPGAGHRAYVRPGAPSRGPARPGCGGAGERAHPCAGGGSAARARRDLGERAHPGRRAAALLALRLRAAGVTAHGGTRAARRGLALPGRHGGQAGRAGGVAAAVPYQSAAPGRPGRR